MTKNITEHSRAVKRAYSKKWLEQNLAAGKKKRLGITADADIVEAFLTLSDDLQLSRPQTLKMLCDFWHQHHAPLKKADDQA